MVRGTARLPPDEHDPAGEEDHDVLKLRHPDESSNKCPNILQRPRLNVHLKNVQALEQGEGAIQAPL